MTERKLPIICHWLAPQEDLLPDPSSTAILKGCIAVEMEYSTLLTAAAYRNVPFIQLLYGADALQEEEWRPNDLTDYGHSHAENHMKLAFTCRLPFDNIVINLISNESFIDNSDITD